MYDGQTEKNGGYDPTFMLPHKQKWNAESKQSETSAKLQIFRPKRYFLRKCKPLNYADDKSNSDDEFDKKLERRAPSKPMNVQDQSTSHTGDHRSKTKFFDHVEKMRVKTSINKTYAKNTSFSRSFTTKTQGVEMKKFLKTYAVPLRDYRIPKKDAKLIKETKEPISSVDNIDKMDENSIKSFNNNSESTNITMTPVQKVVIKGNLFMVTGTNPKIFTKIKGSCTSEQLSEPDTGKMLDTIDIPESTSSNEDLSLDSVSSVKRSSRWDQQFPLKVEGEGAPSKDTISNGTSKQESSELGKYACFSTLFFIFLLSCLFFRLSYFLLPDHHFRCLLELFKSFE